ncbi:MAG: DUF2269 family protein [Actinomycetota bacterium]
MYEYLLFIHVLMAVVWVGGAVTLQVMGSRLQKADDPVQMARFAREVEWIGTRIFTPASLLILIVGIFMVLDAWSFGDLWIVMGLAGFGYSFVNGAFFLGPTSGKTGKMIEERGPEDAEVQSNLEKLFLLSRIELVVLIVVIFAMTVKPTL